VTLAALRDILHRRSMSVALGSIADIGWQPGLGGSGATHSGHREIRAKSGYRRVAMLLYGPELSGAEAF
jgi:hypothetical protein